MEYEMKTLGTVATYINGRAFKPSEWESEGLPIIRIQNLTDANAVFHFSSTNHEEKHRVTSGDLLFAWSASLGAHIWRRGDAWLNQHIFKVIPNDNVDKLYLYYFLCRVVSELYSKTHGSGMVHITKKPFMETGIPIPPLCEQKRIVSRIEELFSQLDSGVETLRTVKQQLDVYRQAVLKEAFDRAGENSVSLKQIIEKPRYGTSKKCSYNSEKSSIPVYRIPNIDYSRGRINHDDLKYTIFSDDEFDSLKLLVGDILIIRSNGSVSLVGRSAVVHEEDTHGLFAGYLMRLRIKSDVAVLPQYLNLYLNTHYARNQIEQMAKSTSGVNNINSDEICQIRLPMCAVELQSEIIREIESRLSVCDSIEKTVDTALRQAKAMRQSILKQAFEGRIR